MKIVSCLLMLLAMSTFPAGAAGAKDCRVPHPPGARAVKPPPGCDLPAKSDRDAASRLKQDGGFVDLGNGTKVKIGGRVRVDVGARP